MKTVFRLVLISLLAASCLVSCKKYCNNTWDIILSVDVEGDLSNSAIISYYDREGQLQVESLTPNWNTTLELDYAADLIVRVEGVIDGRIMLKYEGSIEGGGAFYGERGAMSEEGTPHAFDFTERKELNRVMNLKK
jgi:hypothetical protein